MSWTGKWRLEQGKTIEGNRVHPAAKLFPPLERAALYLLSADIKKHGLISPIVLWKETGQLVDGRNRLRACERADVEPTFREQSFVDDADVYRYVASANLHRRHLTLEQRARLAVELEKGLTRGSGYRSDLAEQPEPPVAQVRRPQARDEAAQLAGVSHGTVQNYKKVVNDGVPGLEDAVQSGAVPITAAAFVAELPADEQVAIVAQGDAEILAAAKRIRAGRQEKRRSERRDKLNKIESGNRPLVELAGTFHVLYADPPWQYRGGTTDPDRAIENHYPTMSLEDIRAMPLSDICAEDAVLFLWATSPLLPEAMQVIEAWGFTYKTSMIWSKSGHGMGIYARINHEFLLIATRGNIGTPPTSARFPSVVTAPKSKHSCKPAEFRRRIEAMYPDLRRVELFSRQPADGWVAWGNQS